MKDKKEASFVIESKEKLDGDKVKVFEHIGKQPPRISKEAHEERKVDPLSLLDAKSIDEKDIKEAIEVGKKEAASIIHSTSHSNQTFSTPDLKWK